MGVGQYVEELLTWLSLHVGPTELSVSPGWYEAAVAALPRDCPLLKLATAIVQHSGDSKALSMRQIPDISRTTSVPETNAVGKNAALRGEAEEFLRMIRTQVQPKLDARVGSAVGRDICRSLETQVARLMFSKALHWDSPTKVASKAEKAKFEALCKDWLKHHENSNPTLASMAVELGIDIQTENVDIIVAANFHDHAFKADCDEGLVKAGFYIGRKVLLTKA